jgi:ParB family chromosome partitioning protein
VEGAKTVEEKLAALRARAPEPQPFHQGGRFGSAPDKQEDVVHIPVDQIVENKYQTRTLLDQEALKKLEESIRMHGVLQPVVVRPMEDGRYMLIMGSRRWTASREAGMKTVPAIVRRVTAMQAAEMTVIENLQREDLTCLDEARAFQRLSSEFGETQEQIGERMGMARETVSNYMRLLRLPNEVKHLLDTRQLDYSRARVLLKLDTAESQTKVALHVVKRKLSVEQLGALLERAMKDIQSGRLGRSGKARYVDPNVQAAQRELERILGVRVKIRDRKGKGKITLEYGSVDEFERVVGVMRGKK